MAFLFSMLLSAASAQPPTDQQPTLLVRVLQPETLQDIQVRLKHGHNTLPLHCGDGQEYPWDGIEDGILTCAYFKSLNLIEHLVISSPSLSIPIYDAVIHPDTGQLPELSFNITRKGSTWTAHRTALHKTNGVSNVMDNPWGWLIAFWSLLITNCLGWIWWNSK